MPFTKNDAQELVIFCGSPGAGKSTFYWDVLQPLGFERVNQDILKTVRAHIPDQLHLDVSIVLVSMLYPLYTPYHLETGFRLRHIFHTA